MLLQARRYPPGMKTQCMQTLATVASVDFVRHVEIRGFGLAVGGEGAVTALREVIVGGVDTAGAVTGGREADDTRGGR